MTATQGWYEDPTNSAQLRFWNGSAWTEHTHPGGAAPASAHTSEAPHEQATATDFAAPEPPRSEGFISAPPAAVIDRAAGPGLYGAPAATKPGTNVGAIVGIVAGVAVLLAVGVVITILAMRGADDREVAADDAPIASASPADEEDDDPPPGGDVAGIDVDDVERPVSRPADYSLPEGYIAYSDPELGVEYGTPGTWVDLTEPYREYYDLGEEDDTPAEIVSYVSAWGSTGDENSGPDDVVITHSLLTRDTDLSLYNKATLRVVDLWLEGMRWDQSEGYVNSVGLPVIKTVGIPEGDDYMLEARVWVVGGGETVVLVSCSVYSIGHGCDEVDTIVDTIWLEP